MNWKAARPKNSVLKSINGTLMPSLKNALNRFFVDADTIQAKKEISAGQI